MPPKKTRKNSKKKKNTTKSTIPPPPITNPTQFQFTNPTPSHPPPPPSFFLNDSDDDFPYDSDEYFDDYGINDYEDYDDFTNPFDPSHHNFIKETKKTQSLSSIFKSVDDLDDYVKNGGNQTSQYLMNLPLDIFLDIISRLSIKPLAICRCVCKTWGTVIHHPRFVKLHHEKITREMDSPSKITSVLFHVSSTVLYDYRDDKTMEVFSEILLLECEKDEGIERGAIANPQFVPLIRVEELKRSDLKFEVVGSCNGLICLADPVFYDPVYVCNPVVGEYMDVPPTYKRMGFEIFPGIGFDRVANESKVFRAIFNFRDIDLRFKMEAEVYTLGSGKWKKVEVGDHSYPVFKRSSSPVFVKGALHWIAEDFQVPELIISFDMGKEEFNLVPPPAHFTETTDNDSDSYDLHLGELGGNLCLFVYSFDGPCNVWTMKEYGVQRSWTKEYVISQKMFGTTAVNFKPFKLMENGNILLVVDNQSVACYEPRRKQFRKLKIQLPPRFDAITHVGSFVSLRNFVESAKSKHCATVGEWYGTMKSVASDNPEIDIEFWKVNDKMRRLWWERN